MTGEGQRQNTTKTGKQYCVFPRHPLDGGHRPERHAGVRRRGVPLHGQQPPRDRRAGHRGAGAECAG